MPNLLRLLYLLGVLLVAALASASTAPAPQSPPLPPSQAPATPSSNVVDAPVPTFLAQGSDPEQVADEAIANWQARASASPLSDLSTMRSALLDHEDPRAYMTEVCQELSSIADNPSLVKQLEVNLASRQLLHQEEALRTYSYAAGVADSSALAQVRVQLRQDAGIWYALHVQSKLEGIGSSLPASLAHPLVGWLFAGLSIYVLMLLLRPSWYRRLLTRGWQILRQHRVITMLSIVLLYGSYLLGSAAGLSLPACQAGLVAMVRSSLQDSGIVTIISEGNLLDTAAVITLWNFMQGTLATSFLPALLLALPAYLLNASRFFIFGFALAPTHDIGIYAWHIPVIIIELMAYILVTAGGAIMVATIMRRGLRATGEGVRMLLYMLPPAFLLLWIGAWYEAIEIQLIIPMLLRP